MAFDHPGISSGEDPRGESDKDRSGLSWIAEYVFGPEYVFGHIILMSTFRTMDVFGHGCHSKLRSLSSRIQNQDSRGFHARHRPGPANQKNTCCAPHASGGEPEAAFSASRRKLDLPNEAPHRPTTHRAGFQPSESRDDRG